MSPEQEELLAAAAEAALNAHAPYSNFRVGAAVLTNEGVFTGANIENACTNIGICAERVAISHARMHGGTTINGIAIACIDARAGDSGKLPPGTTMPCGACRQWLAELAPDAWLISNGSAQIYSLKDLLPSPFTL